MSREKIAPGKSFFPIHDFKILIDSIQFQGISRFIENNIMEAMLFTMFVETGERRA